MGRKGDKRPRPRSAQSVLFLTRVNYEYDPSDTELLKSLLNATARKAEKELMLAVLETAIEDFRRYASAKDQKGKSLYEDAQSWILERESEWFLSFDNICETLSISSDRLRRSLLREQQTRRKAA